MLTILSAGLSLGVDRFLGEPACYHPLIGFGKIADKCESLVNQSSGLFVRGMLAWCLLIIPVVALVYWLDNLIGGLWLGVLCGWLAIGSTSLRQHALAVFDALSAGDLDKARQTTRLLVSRDTTQLDETALSKATIESVLENGSDAIFAPLFWLVIGGAPLVVLYRLANTLDAMWGYRNDRFEQFGKFSAWVDDLLNYIPARFTALLYALSGKTKKALKAWKHQGRQWYSPNAGVVMATGAAALDLQLGGDAVYHGKLKQRPVLGGGKQAGANDIVAVLHLIRKSEYLFLLLLMLLLLMGLILFGFEQLTAVPGF